MAKTGSTARTIVLVASVLLTMTAAAATESSRPFSFASGAREFIVVDWDREAIREMAGREGPQLVRDFPLRAGLSLDLEIERFSVTSPSTQFVLGRKGGEDQPIDFDPSSISMFRGRIVDAPGSHVFLAFSDTLSTGHIDLGPGHPSYRIHSRGNRSAGVDTGAGEIEVFETVPAPARPPGVPFCGSEKNQMAVLGSPVPESNHPVKGLKHLELAIETDHELFQLFGNTTDTLNYVTLMYAQVSDVYVRDVDTRVELSFVRIWDDPNDLFNVVDPSPLSGFRDYWNANMGAVQRDVAQLFSGRRDYPFGGQAYLSAFCGSNAYSVVGYAMGFFPDPSRPSPYHYDISVTAHEIGHNAGTGHTHDSPNFIDTCNDPQTTAQRGTIMSYCSQTWSGGNANRDLYFHSSIQQNMDAFIATASCVVADCNRNSVVDSLDISNATSTDADLNGVPDECEDCNDNSVLDDADIASMTSQDLDLNGIPDECEPDCNANNVPDAKDIDDGTSFDLHGNDIPDECEADCDADSLPDYDEIQNDMTLDVNRDAQLDVCEDCDTDGTIDLVELDNAHFAWVASGLTGSDLRQFHPDTGVLTAVSSGGMSALVDEGFDLIVAPNGSVLVTSHADSRVLEFDLDGNSFGDLIAAGGGGLSGPTGLIVAPDDTTLLVASSLTNSVLSYDLATGNSLGAFVAAGSGGLSVPFGLTFGPNGNLFVTGDNGSVLEYDGLTGASLGDFVPAAFNGGLDQPRGLVFKPDGNLLVASFGTDEVLEYDGQTGESLGKWAQVGTASVLTQTSPWGVRVAPNGNVFVSRTGADHGSGSAEHGDHHHDDDTSIGNLHLSNAQIYEYDSRNGNFLRTYVGGNDHGLIFPTGFDFVPGFLLDCNVTFLPDECDLLSGASLDADFSGVPDECEIDCNGNFVFDRLDLIPYGTSPDCNSNGSPDECDLADAISLDCTSNGIPDECERDCNATGTADTCDLLLGSSVDCDANGIPDECDTFDDLEAVTGWTAGAVGDTATTGIWTLVDPVGTGAQPELDHTPSGTQCFVTGQGLPGGTLGAADIDGGNTTLTTPPIDVAGSPDAEIGYWRWFSNDAGSNPGQDIMTIDVTSNGGMNWINVEVVGPTTESSGGWLFHSFRVADFVPPTSGVKLRFVAGDTGGGSIVEAAIDDLVVVVECCPASVPVDVTGLLLDKVSDTRLLWDAQGGGMIYDVIRGDLSSLRSNGAIDDGLCAIDDWPGSGWDDLQADPLSGQAYYYLVRAEDSCQPGTTSSYGTASSGSPRVPLIDCP